MQALPPYAGRPLAAMQGRSWGTELMGFEPVWSSGWAVKAQPLPPDRAGGEDTTLLRGGNGKCSQRTPFSLRGKKTEDRNLWEVQKTSPR